MVGIGRNEGEKLEITKGTQQGEANIVIPLLNRYSYTLESEVRIKGAIAPFLSRLRIRIKINSNIKFG